MTFYVIHQPETTTGGSPYRIVDQSTGREVEWVNRFLDREWIRRVAETTLRSYAMDLLHFLRWCRRQSPMLQEPFAEGNQGSWCFWN